MMDRITQFISRLVNTDYSQVPLFLSDILRNPQQNPTAFILLLSGATVVFALVIIAVVATFLAVSDEDDDEYYDDEQGRVEPLAVEGSQVEQEEQEEPYREPNRLLWGVVWVALFAAVWVLAGTVTRDDAVCASCHVNADLHAARSQEESIAPDPHRRTACVACHETPSAFASVTTRVPARAAHLVGGMIASRYAGDYGTPVTNSACLGCHERTIAQTTLNRERGTRMSHKEPLEANALCTDCHEPSDTGGVVDAYTVGMDPCLRCHDMEVASAECSYCHTKDIGASVKRAGTFEPRSHVAEMDCSGCHTNQTRCNNCHGMAMPHTRAFIGGGHARAAVEDLWYNEGRLCKRCHTKDRRPCTRCHDLMPGHAPSYMIEAHKKTDPYNNGCGGCHDERQWIVGRNFCGNCHDRYKTPFQ